MAGDDALKDLIDLLIQKSPDSRSTERKATPLCTFLYSPLHDYEPVWWIATWVLFKCRPKSLGPEELDYSTQSQQPSIFHDKTDREHAILAPGVFLALKRLLPCTLHPLFEILEVFRRNLVRVYREYEESFDGSVILRNVEVFHLCLEKLAKAATKIEIWDFPRSSTMDPSATRLHLPQGAGHVRGSGAVNVSQGTPDGSLAPELQSGLVQIAPAQLGKRKASGPLDSPPTMTRLHSDQRRASPTAVLVELEQSMRRRLRGYASWAP